MQAALTTFCIQFLISLLEKLLKKGTVAWVKFQDMKEAIKKAEKYEEVVNNPNSSIDDRLRAEDDLLT